MTQTFTNLDAQFLVDLASRLAELPIGTPGRNTETEARLVLCAQHLQSMDEKLVNLQNARSYSDGVRDERLRILGRSNLPLQSAELSPELSMELAKRQTAIKPRRAERAEPAPRKAGLSSAILKDLKIDLSQLGVKS